MRSLLIAVILVMSMFLFACSQAEQQVDTEDTTEVIEDTTEVVEDTTEVAWATKTLPEPWPQDFLVQENLEIISEIEAEGNLVLVANFAEDTEPGVFDLYDYYYDGNSGWKVPEGLGMSCSATGDALTVILGGEEGTITVVGAYIGGLLTMTYSLTPALEIVEPIEEPIEEPVEDTTVTEEPTEEPVEDTTVAGEE